MKGKVLKKAALGMALGACLASMAPLAMAQSATGAVAGRASAGDQIMITNTATGATRSVTVGGDGGYRLSQLPVGDYQLQVKRNGEDVGESVAVNVALGGTTTVNLGSDGGPNAWTEINGGDGGYVAVKPSNTNILYAETTGISIERSTDGGATFSSIVGCACAVG